MTIRAAVYLRISQDRQGGGAGVERQRSDCENLVHQRGWIVAGDYVDNDVSAFDSRKPRPQWNRLLDDIEKGNVDALVAWHTDRLYRLVRDLPPLIDLVKSKNIQIATVMSGDLDLNTSTGRFMATILVGLAEQESALKSERLRAQRAQAADAGKANGGPRVYGYNAEMSAVVPEEGKIIEEIAGRLLSGDSLRSVVIDLNARGVPTARGGTWRTATVNQMIVSARFAGMREHTPGGSGPERKRGRGMGEIVAKGSWPAILTLDETERLRENSEAGHLVGRESHHAS